MYYSRVRDLLGHGNPCKVEKQGPTTYMNCQTKYYKEVKDG
jgi:abortive infection bacteriophage resistance protein